MGGDSNIRKNLLALLISILVFIFLAAIVFFIILDTPAGDSEAHPTVEIAIRKGDTVSAVAENLKENNLINSRQYLILRYRVQSRLGISKQILAGRYLIKSETRPSKIIRIITTPGSNLAYTTLTIPPGLTSTRIARRVEDIGIAKSSDVRQAIIDMGAEYPILANPGGLQGYMFPDTYRIETPIEKTPENSMETARFVVRMMADKFFETLDEIDSSWVLLTPGQLHEKVILASIVEREYRVKEEAPLIAAVFNNRILEGMAMQSCATVVYTIEETDVGLPFQSEYLRFNRRIFEQYLEIPSPYNTYYYGGLPPGPISVPGRISLSAAFFPANSDALYFVVKDAAAGTHTFTRNYDAHLDAKSVYLSQYVVKD